MSSAQVNFRDFGGIRAGSAYVVRGSLFRCGYVATPDDEPSAAAPAYTLAIDLRRTEERHRVRVDWQPRPDTVLTLTPAPGGEAPHRSLVQRRPATVAEVDQFYDALYREIPFGRYYGELIGRSLQALARAQGPSIMFCSAGKDRTGMLAALTLTVLGVHADDVMADYLVSATDPSLQQHGERILHDVQGQTGHVFAPAVATRLMGVQPQYLAATFEAIEGRCGSVERYLDMLGVTADERTRLRKRLLIDPPTAR